MNNYHYITWEEGFTSFKEVHNIMNHFCSKFTKFYTTGSKKRNWINMYTTKDVYDTHIDKGYDKESYEGVCVCVQNQGHSASNCALQKAYRLAGFLQQCGNYSVMSLLNNLAETKEDIEVAKTYDKGNLVKSKEVIDFTKTYDKDQGIDVCGIRDEADVYLL